MDLVAADLCELDEGGSAWLVGRLRDLEDDLATLEAFDAFCFARDAAIGAA